ncbi:MAG TPA: flagellar brake protein [Pseudomonas xinjiangensis]|uniref:Flagellar brake protein n=2 Tax=root TaxID=1 RepID=A0A7V1BS30_9GAMM|nr:flagellar brake protein [Halopseudomonas xinjiangensis]HEC46959.1 flagellar brake protein [Halopseudomonas xinjiangensis]
MPLIPLKENDIALGVPLPWSVMDAEGKVIFEQSRTVDNQPLLTQLFKLGLYRSAPETDADEKLDVAGNGSQAEVQLSTLAQVQLAPGDLVQLQTLHPTHAERYQVRMIGFHAPVSILVSTPIVQGRLAFIKEGQQFLVRGFVGKDAVAYKTRVLKSNLSPFPYLHLAYPETVQSMRIRSSARVSVELVTSVMGPSGQAGAKLIDLSVGGARLLSPRPFAEKGDEVKMSFRINPSGLDVYMTIKAKVRAVHRDETGQGNVATGVEFSALTDQDRLYLTNMVYQNLLKDTL